MVDAALILLGSKVASGGLFSSISSAVFSGATFVAPVVVESGIASVISANAVPIACGVAGGGIGGIVGYKICSRKNQETIREYAEQNEQLRQTNIGLTHQVIRFINKEKLPPKIEIELNRINNELTRAFEKKDNEKIKEYSLKRSEIMKIVKMFEEGQEENIESSCVICLNKTAKYVFDNCGHLCICDDCIEETEKYNNELHTCPVCRIVADRIIRVYIPN